MDAKTALLYTQTNSFKFLLSKTKGFIRWSLAQVNNPYVACSFGKDSAVMLHLVLQQCQDIKVKCYTFEYSELLNDYRQVIEQWSLPNFDRVEVGMGLGNYREIEVMQQGHDAAFVGIRMQESVARRISIKRHSKFYKKKNGVIRIAPLAEWTDADISAYILSNQLPTLATYKAVGFNSRTTTGLGHGYEQDQLDILKKTDIDKYNQLMTDYSQFKNYIDEQF